MRVGLMTHVPHQTIFGRIEHVMQRYCEFDYTKTCPKMTACLTYGVKKVEPQLIG